VTINIYKMRGLTCALFATFLGGLLSCSDEGQATKPLSYLHRKSEYMDRGERGKIKKN
jgi:hypothetical protein